MSTIQRSKITRADLALWNGSTKSVSRIAASGDTVTSLTVGDYVDLLQVFGDGTERTLATINTALAAVGTTNNMTLLWSTGTWAITSSVTIPANLSNQIPAGCVFAIANGATLTFSGPVHVEFSTSTGTGWYTLTGSGAISCSLGASGFPGW